MNDECKTDVSYQRGYIDGITRAAVYSASGLFDSEVKYVDHVCSLMFSPLDGGPSHKVRAAMVTATREAMARTPSSVDFVPSVLSATVRAAVINA